MKKTIYICDVCGKEKENFSDLYDLVLSDKLRKNFKIERHNVEICLDCIKGMIEYVKKVNPLFDNEYGLPRRK